MKKLINKKTLILISLLLLLPLLVGCFSAPPTNQSPTITSTPITTATVAAAYAYNVNATDPDGDTLTYSLTTKPSGMIINSSTGLITWTPTAIGDYNVTIEVSDGVVAVTQSFTITVSAAPVVPVAVTGVTLDESTLALTVGDAAVTLVATVTPATATDTSVIWASSNETAAVVAAGVVTPLNAGISAITATTVDGGFVATCVVTVSAAAIVVPPVTPAQTDAPTIISVFDLDSTESDRVAVGDYVNFGIKYNH
jgi:hypothetical protein